LTTQKIPLKLFGGSFGIAVLIAATGAGASGSAGAAVQPQALRPAMTTVAGSVAAFTSDTSVTGTVAASKQLSIQVWLQPRTAAATSFAQAVSTPGGAQFKHYLSPDAYTARFGATQSEADAVQTWLRGRGFTAVSTGPQRSYVQATAPASTIDQAFKVRLKLYKSSAAVNAGTQALWSNDRPIVLPSTLAGVVSGVTGLSDATPIQAETGVTQKAATACSAYYGQHVQSGLPAHFGKRSFPTQVCGYSAKQLRAVYGANMTNTGKGVTIAFTEMSPAAPDMLLTLQDYAKASGLPVPTSKQYSSRTSGKVCVGDVSGTAKRADTGPIDPEEEMDVEAAYAMAPGANELVVYGLTCGTDGSPVQSLLNAVGAVLGGSGHHPLASIVSNSWTSDTEVQPASVTKIEHTQLLQAAAEGVGMYDASGDDPDVWAPSDDPYATAVGGTTLGIGKTENRLFETGWSTGWLTLQSGKWVSQGGFGGSGGGPSVVWKQPSYQHGVVPAALSKAPGHSGQWRSTPDISADADPATPMAVGVLNVQPGKKPQFFMTPGGGTSQATPLVAGMVAAAQQGAKKPFGFLNPVLYKLAGTSALRDVLPITATTPALYRGTTCDVTLCGVQGLFIFDDQATSVTHQVTLKGYDNMSGLGTPAGQNFIAALRAREK